MSSAVVFAYHNVGVRCLKVLLAAGVDVKLVVTHEDNPHENIWFASVAQTCRDYGIPYITPADPNVTEVEAQVAALQADFLFSFYYRHMLKAPLLSAPTRGAFNLHGSLLPKYRGRVPINWAVIHGESETGATLHVMNSKPDNGPIVDQQAVPILPDDTAQEVFDKVLVAAEICLQRSLPGLLAGTATFTQQDLSLGGYFGGRKAEDGRINWSQGAAQIHNLVRAVTAPYPGAFSELPGGRLVIWRTLHASAPAQPAAGGAALWAAEGALWARTGDGACLKVLAADWNGAALDAARFALLFNGPLQLQ
ncbi:methionyl-tRNA formyltransferase [Andreprevotia lacus DSM 23236]|jgi:methionyl-tRNA formyltransferase|uniref:Methionyl-tRNA formyltransferase n=1 Tax=Andreprevotia lacus DSM 23236 TaxID=1121001 RepID=A0A1W1XZE2_9NEIS|nr:formyltransferase [Andreprevotia lacus]SMC29286.1 methionyl-tRNA formyltransferase [Andreprevotia lacus DSM 23236]